jgi:2-polyprenyl-6-methoxyphenol hydroxylase-like FAD-dependent oxidoreductase
LKRIAIIGGGIGGLTTAIALLKQGHEVRVFEEADELREVGAGIWVPPNAMQVLDRLGLGSAVETAGVLLRRIEIRTEDGTVLQAIDLDPIRRRFGRSTVSIHRARLQQLLADRVPVERIVTGKRCVAVEEAGEGLHIHFADATREEADIVIGADGLHSAVRRFVAPAARLRDAGQTTYRAISRYGTTDPTRSQELWGTKARFGISAIGATETYWWCAYDGRADDVEDPASTLRRLRRLAATFPEPMPSLLEHSQEGELIRAHLFDLRPMPRWWRGNVVLVGDAAHATTPNLGQGGAQAIEDAYVLAEALSANASEVEQAFRAYERTRRPRADRVVAASWRIGKLAHVKSRAGRAVRDAAVRLTPAWVTERQLHTLYELDY